MKFIIFLTLLFLSLNAQIDKTKMYAHVISKSADLYEHPYECAKKKENYFKKGEILQIIYCNQYRWCTVKNGYVKQDLLNIVVPKYMQKSPKTKIIQKKIENIKIVEDYKPKMQKPKIEVIEVFPAVVEINKENLGPYEEYFSPDSKKLIFEKNR